MGTTNILDLNNRVTALKNIPTTASGITYDNTDSGLTATDVQGAVDELAESYPANKVMMSDGVTNVEDKIGNIIFVEKSISNVSVSIAWGSMFLCTEVVNITSLGLSNAPDVISATFSTTESPVALCLVAGVNKNNIPISLARAVSGTVSGKIMLMLKSNG